VSVPATLFRDFSEMEGSAPGSIAFEADEKGLFYMCPCGCGLEGFLPFRGKAEPERPSWIWDGNRDKPTLAPSILRTAGCHWHGYLQAGVWVPA
jgi:hypothetical protein